MISGTWVNTTFKNDNHWRYHFGQFVNLELYHFSAKMSWIYNDPPKLAHKFFSVNYFTSLQRTLLPPRLRLTNHHLPYILQDRNRINIQHHSTNLVSLYLTLFLPTFHFLPFNPLIFTYFIICIDLPLL